MQVLFDCHDERLIQNPETKEIVGAYTMIGSEEKTVKARKGVIMTTGGFEFNEDLKNAYLKCYPFKFEGCSSTRATASRWSRTWERSCGTWTWRSPCTPCGRAILRTTSPSCTSCPPTATST